LEVVADWATTKGDLKSATIGFHRFQGSHSGSNIASALWNILERFELTRKIGYMTTDNATNNDTAIAERAVYFEDIGVEFNPRQSRVRCFGHIINLVVKAFLWGEDWQAFEAEISTELDIKKAASALKLWRKKGPLGKLHKISSWILHTPQRHDRFSQKVKQLRSTSSSTSGPLLPMFGNVTRWSSDTNSIERAFILKDAVEDFIGEAIRDERQTRTRRQLPTELDYNHDQMNNLSQPPADENPEHISTDELTLNDWEDLKLILRILKLFGSWTLLLQGTGTERTQSNGYIARVLPAIDELLAHLEESKEHYCYPTLYSVHLSSSIKRAWAILDK